MSTECLGNPSVYTCVCVCVCVELWNFMCAFRPCVERGRDVSVSCGISCVHSGRVLSEGEMYELLAAAVYMYLKRETANRSFINQEWYTLPHACCEDPMHAVRNGMHYPMCAVHVRHGLNGRVLKLICDVCCACEAWAEWVLKLICDVCW